jgi:hypothetical protein
MKVVIEDHRIGPYDRAFTYTDLASCANTATTDTDINSEFQHCARRQSG